MIRRALAVLLLPLGLLTVAVAAEDPGGAAKKTLSDLEASHPSSASSHQAPLEAAAAPIREAKKLLERAAELRRLGDTARAEIAEDGALEWALAARELVRAVELEHEAVDQAAAADVSATKAQKARTLLDEAIARRAKLQQQLDDLDHEAEARALDAGPAKDAGKPNKKGGKP